MLTLIQNLILINLIVVLIFKSGFVDDIDDIINKKFPFHHLPKPFSCALCMTTWISIFWVAIAGQISLLSICLCLINASLTSVTLPLITVIENWLLRIISWIMPK